MIRALEALRALEDDCGFGVVDRLYTAHIAYGTLLEQRGRRDEAIQAYFAALQVDPQGADAVRRLTLLQAFTPLPPPACDPQLALDIPPYVPSNGAFVETSDTGLSLAELPYPVYGINYYPRDYPNARFLMETNVASLAFEMEILRAAGINTLRVFIRHEALFTCQDVPDAAALARLDAFIQLAGAWGLRLILVLNDAADIGVYSGQTLPQMAFIAARYSAEPVVLAYDLRAGGDADYGSGALTRTQVLAWLAEAARIVREAAPDQLLTASWDDDSAVTAPLVDFVSFQHEGEVEALRQEIAILKAATGKPILLAHIGYNTFDRDELGQRLAYQRALEAVAQNDLVGWVITTAFDYPPLLLCNDPANCPERSPENTAGLWTNSYFPKLALEAVRQATDS
ncbi:MAG: hypothetical protein OHK0046_05170 [Anaerolineae bacterium]